MIKYVLPEDMPSTDEQAHTFLSMYPDGDILIEVYNKLRRFAGVKACLASTLKAELDYFTKEMEVHNDDAGRV